MIDSGALLLDVREPNEWAAGHAPDALHIPMGDIGQRAGELPTDRPIVCVCHVGRRSAMVVSALRQAGFDAYNLDGGMEAWWASGRPVVDDSGRDGVIV